MRNRWTVRLATLALATVIGSGATVFAAGAAEGPPPGVPIGQPKPYRGVVGYEVVSQTFPNVANLSAQTVYCHAGKRALGGGANVPTVATEPVLVGSFPAPEGTGWTGVGRSDTASIVTITVYAVCAPVSS